MKYKKRNNTQKRKLAVKNMLIDFIACYKNNPILWDLETEKQHKNRKYLKQRAYENLAQILRQVENEATVADVKRKINTLRSSYRKESKKTIKARKEGRVYKPTTWWYNLMLFINYGHIKSDAEETDDEVTKNDEVSTTMTEKRKGSLRVKAITNAKQVAYSERSLEADDYNSVIEENLENDQIEEETDNLSNSENDYYTQTAQEYESEVGYGRKKDREDIYFYLSKIWATKLRNISRVQFLLAEKAINDILFDAELGLLTQTPSQKKISSNSFVINIENVKDDNMDGMEEEIYDAE